MATVTTAQIQQIYIGFLGRAADKAGLDYWVNEITNDNLTLEQLRANITNEQAEYTGGYGQLSRGDLIDAVYQALFERAPDAAGKAYWETGDGAGVNADRLIQAFIDGASTDDQSVLDNKTEVAEYYTTSAGTNYSAASAASTIADVDGGAGAVAAGKALVDTQFNQGTTFTLTADDENIAGTDLDDTIVAATGTLNNGDIIVDGSTTDNDTLNVVYKTAADLAATATIAGVENINVDLQVFSGGVFDAANVTDATITGSSNKLGFDGDFQVDNTEDNNVVAGTNVTTLDVNGLEAGTVDAGAATTVEIAHGGTADAEVVAVTVNGDTDLDVDFSGAGTSEALNITASAASTVTLNAASTVAVANLTVTGSGALSIDTEAANVTGATVTGVDVLNIVDAAGGLDAENLTVGSIEVSDTAAMSVTNAEGQTVTLSAENGDLTVNTSGTTNTESVTVNVTADQATGSITVDTNTNTAAVALAAAVADVATLTYAGDTTVTVAGNVTLADVDEAAATDTLVVSGAGDVTVDAIDAADADFSGVTGAVDLTLDGTTQSIVTGAAADTVTLGTATGIVSIAANGGNDTVDADAITTGTVAAELGAGDDSISFDAVGAATIALDGGAGTDTLALTAADFTTAATFALTNFENLTTDGASVFNADQLSGETLAVAGTAEAGDTLTVNAEAADTVIDLSGLTVADTIDANVAIVATAATGAVTITGTATDDTITASGNADVIDAGAGDDTIVSAAGAETITGGAGDDTFTLASTEAALDAITDYTAAADAADNDTLDVTAAVVVADVQLVDNMDVSAADAAATATDILAIVSDGVLTVGGTEAAAIDTLAEWFDVAALASADTTANVLAFEFNGNTYLYEDSGADAEVASVELTGVTGITAVSTTAAADTILIG